MSTAEHAQNQGLTTEQIAAAGAGPGPDEAAGDFGDVTEPEQAQPGASAEPVTPPAVPPQGEMPPPPPDDLAPPSDQPFDEQPLGERPSGGQDQAQGQDQARGTDWTGQQQAGPGPVASPGRGAADPGLAAQDPGPATGDPGLAQGLAGQPGYPASQDVPAQQSRPQAMPPQPLESLEPQPGGTGPADGQQDGPQEGQHARLLAEDEMNSIVSRWKTIQADFVDEPRKAVEEADALVAELMQRLASMFAAERADLERRWSGGDGVSTEDLRVSLRRYRSFFERLLAA